MHRIGDKKRWWAAHCCKHTVAPRQNPAFDILLPIGLAVAVAAILAIGMIGYHFGGADGVALAEAPTFALIKDAIEKIGTSFEQYKSTNDERIKAVNAGNEGKAKELADKLGRIEADVASFSKLKNTLEIEMQLHRERLEELEAARSNPVKSAAQKKKDDYKDTFFNWVRSKGNSSIHEHQMQEMMRNDVTIGTGAAGGYAVPEETARQIEQLEKKFSPVRRLVKVVQTGTSDYKELVGLSGTTDMVIGSGWVGETGSRSATSTPQLREVTPTHGELYAYPQASEWSLDDMFFNVENWIADEAAQAFAYQEGVAVLTGNGTSKPTGMLNTSPVTTADWASPLRAAAAYQYIANTASPIAIDADKLIDMIYALNSRYRSEATWTMNSVTTGAIRKLKDSNGVYHWQPGLQMGQPNTLLGFPIETWEQMDDVGSNKYPVAFGNFRRGYVLADRVGLRITRDNVTNVGFVRFYIRRREGGIVLNNDAIKFLKTS